MLDLENLNGFVIDLFTEKECDKLIEDILCGDENEYDRVIKYTLGEKRAYIIRYFTETYAYVFCKSPFVYLIVEEELEVKR